MANSVRPDVVLINPASRQRVYQSLAKQLAAVEPPVWAGLMASYVRGKGFGVELIDAEAQELTAEDAARQALEFKPLLIAVVVYGHQPSASTQIMPTARAVCMEIKKIDPTAPILLVGGHVAALPERTLQEEAADFTCSGEGLFTLVELLSALKNQDVDYDKVSDLYYRAGNVVARSTKRAPLVTELDAELPHVAWDLLPMTRYRAHNWHCLGNVDGRGELDRSPYAAIYTTLGCPYKCSFCCIQAPFKSGEAELGMRAVRNSYRFWSPERVVDTLQFLNQEHGVRNVKFADEMFVLNRSHVERICDLIIERQLDLNIWAYARVDTVTDGMLPRLKKAGFHWLAFGIEAANAKVRNDVQKGFDQDDIFRTLERVRDAGIHVIGNYIFGLPEDDYSTMQETLDLAFELNCEFGNFYCAMAYPGSPLYLHALERRWQLPETWGGYSQHAYDTMPLQTNYLTAAEVLDFRDKAFQSYYNRPRYLDMVCRKFGPETVRHLVEMTAHKLERKLTAGCTKSVTAP